MAHRSSLLVFVALAPLCLAFAAALSATSVVPEIEPLTGSAGAVKYASSSAAAAFVTSSADAGETYPATGRILDEQPSGVSEGNAEPAVTGLQGSAEQEEPQALPDRAVPHVYTGSVSSGRVWARPAESVEVEEPLPLIRVGCGGIISVRMFEPNVFGGLMLRGRGNIVFIRAFPRIALRQRYEAQPDFDLPASRDPGMPEAAAAEAYSSSSSSSASDEAMKPRPLPFSEDVGPEGVARSMESLFAMAHPLSLFRENTEELDRWHAARMRALAALQGEMIHRAMVESSLEEPTVVATSDTASAGAERGAEAEQPRLVRELVAAPELDASALGDMGPIEWNSTAVCGLVLLGLSLSLLLSMLLLGLSSLIYGAPEEEQEEDEKAAALKEASVQTPLLKVEEEPEGKAAPMNHVCKYEPPAQK